jgi:hypothetical protein
MAARWRYGYPTNKRDPGERVEDATGSHANPEHARDRDRGSVGQQLYNVIMEDGPRAEGSPARIYRGHVLNWSRRPTC